jgi:hypothetical protein
MNNQNIDDFTYPMTLLLRRVKPFPYDKVICKLTPNEKTNNNNIIENEFKLLRETRKNMDNNLNLYLTRMWINQPSNLQPLHKLHGTKVLANITNLDSTVIYFIDGDTISMTIPRNALASGWK